MTISILNETLATIKAWAKNQSLPSYQAEQIWAWMYLHHNFDPQTFTNLSLKTRELLLKDFDWTTPVIDSALMSVDGSEKILLKLHDNKLCEMVIMPSDNRVTLCISSQVGCKMACTFCQTGKMGFLRNLSVGEILYQITLANTRISERKVTNIVFMGMGEPLDNYDNVVEACRVMTSEKYFGLSKHRVTVSTSGIPEKILELGRDVPVSLAISLHTAIDEERSKIMPINRKYPLPVLKEALLKYPVQTRHGITFEYVMIQGVNDSLLHAKKLVSFLSGLQAKVNLIPMNAHPGSTMSASLEETIRQFQKYLSDRSIPAPVRYSRGQDISGACGQLATKRQDELHMTPRSVALSRQKEYRNASSGVLSPLESNLSH